MCDRPWCTCESYDEVEAERDRYREALEQIAVCCDNGATNENKLTFIRKVARKALNA